MKSTLLTLLCIFLFSSNLLSQTTIWSENFNSYTNGTTTGASSSWTSACGACSSGDYFEVRSGLFSAGDVNDFSTWESQSIDISGFASISFSLDAIEVGDHEGPGCNCGVNVDYLDVYYSIDGGSFAVIEDWNGDGDTGHTLTGDSQNGSATDADWGTTTVTHGGFSGSTLVIRVVMRNTAGSEVLSIDNILVQGFVPLPVELIELEGKNIALGNEITWKTASELNNSHFILEASDDLLNFEAIAKIQGAGTSNELNEYQYIDRKSTGITYYRLQQVDFNGKHTFSEIISVSRESQSIPYPNPFGENLFIKLETPSTLSFYSVDGKQLTQTMKLAAGDHELGQKLAFLPAGFILLTVENGQSHQTYRLRKL